MSFEIILVFIILAVAVVLLITEWILVVIDISRHTGLSPSKAGHGHFPAFEPVNY